MKKTKILLSSVLLAAPMVASIPTIVGCSKGKQTVFVSDELAKNIDMETIVDGDSYYFVMSIKEDLVGKQFLPTSLTKVKSGDVELTPISQSNDLVDYYSYTTYENNTMAILFVRMFRGSITIEGSTSTISSITASGIDITGRKIAEFEDGETFSYNTSRVVALANLSNGQSFVLEDGYTIDLNNSTFVPGYEFKVADRGQSGKGSVTFSGVKSNEFDWKVVHSTAAYVTYESLLGEINIDKKPDFLETKAWYNDSTDYGYYTIAFAPTTFTADPGYFTFTQSVGKYLTLKPFYDPKVAGMTVHFGLNAAADYDSIITIKGDGSTTNSSVTIKGIDFVAPTVGTLENEVFYDIKLDGTAHDVTVESCKFSGDTTGKNYVDAIYASPTGTTVLPKNIIVDYCVADYVTNLFAGVVACSGGIDVLINDCILTRSKGVADFGGSEISCIFRKIYAGLSLSVYPQTSRENGGFLLGGTGNFRFSNCYLSQINKLSTTENVGFIQLHTLAGYEEGSNRSLSFNECGFYHYDEEYEDKVFDVVNATNTADKDWNISWTNSYGVTETSVVKGSGTPTTWDHTI